MKDMHESFKRLLDCAREATKDQPAAMRVTAPGHLTRHLSASSATLTNWKKRGVSQEGALEAEVAFGCSPAWVLEGKGSTPAAPAQPVNTQPVRELSAEAWMLGHLLDQVTPDRRRQYAAMLAVEIAELLREDGRESKRAPSGMQMLRTQTAPEALPAAQAPSTREETSPTERPSK